MRFGENLSSPINNSTIKRRRKWEKLQKSKEEEIQN